MTKTCLNRAIKSAMLAVVMGVGMSSALATEPELSPAMKAYDDLSVVREKHSDVIWGGKAATPDEVHQIIGALEHDLIRASEPLYRDLAEGNLFLRYRRFNILIDLVKLHARLNEPERAFARLAELHNMSWDVSSVFDDPNVAKLKALPGFAPFERIAVANKRWSELAVVKSPYQEQLPVAERIVGLSRLWTVVRDGFVWFDHTPKDFDWDQAYLDAIPEVIAAKDTAAYYDVMIKLVAKLKDGHTNVYYPNALQDRFYARPGIRTRLVGDQVVVSSIQDAGLLKAGVKTGDELLAVEGLPVKEYAAKFVAPLQSSSTPQDLEIRAFAYGLLSGDAKTPVALTLRDGHGKEYQISAPRSGYETVPAQSKPLFSVREDGIAVLVVNQLENDEALRAFRANLGALLKAKGLVLDLRGNGGGSTDYGTEILKYLTREPMPGVSQFYRENTYLDMARSNPPSIGWRGGPVDPDARLPKEHFAGPVAMLIDARTFSAGEDTAAVFKMMKRGTILGKPSGGSTGQPLMFDLPGGGMARVCVKRDRYPDGTDFVGVGVIPDIEAGVTVADFRDNADSVMDRAVALLLEQAKAASAP